jgi:hypothetical protein
MVLDTKKVDDSRMIFRPSMHPEVAIFRGDLVKKLEAAKLSGVEFTPLAEYES